MCAFAERSLVVLFAVCTAVNLLRADDELDIGCFSTSTAGTVEQRCFTLHKTAQTWHEAETSCVEDGGLLAVINEPQIEEMVGKVLTSLEKYVEDDSGFNVWIGGREVKDSTWKWLNGEQFQIGKTAKGNMSVSFGSDVNDYENCAAVSIATEGSTLELKSFKCRTEMKQVLCQQQVSTTVNGNMSDTGPCTINGVSGIRVNETCYAAVSAKQKPVSWFKAVAECQSLNATLAVSLDVNFFSNDISVDVNSTNVQEDVVNYLESANIEPGESIWIGLQRYPWVWVTQYDAESSDVSGTEPMSYTAWFEPDQPNKFAQDCVLISLRGHLVGWYDAKCDDEAAYICEERSILTTTATPEAATMAVSVTNASTSDVDAVSSPRQVIALPTAVPSNATSSIDGIDEEESDGKLFTAIVVCSLIGLVVLTIFAAVCAYCACRRSGYERQP